AAELLAVLRLVVRAPGGAAFAAGVDQPESHTGAGGGGAGFTGTAGARGGRGAARGGAEAPSGCASAGGHDLRVLPSRGPSASAACPGGVACRGHRPRCGGMAGRLGGDSDGGPGTTRDGRTDARGVRVRCAAGVVPLTTSGSPVGQVRVRAAETTVPQPGRDTCTRSTEIGRESCRERGDVGGV